MTTEIAPAYPFVRDDSGNFHIICEYDLMEAEIIQALKIKKGIRPMWKSIGSTFDIMLFENDLDSKQGLAKKLIKDIVERSVIGCCIEDAKIYKDSENGATYYISITYRHINTNITKTFTHKY